MGWEDVGKDGRKIPTDTVLMALSASQLKAATATVKAGGWVVGIYLIFMVAVHWVERLNHLLFSLVSHSLLGAMWIFKPTLWVPICKLEMALHRGELSYRSNDKVLSRVMGLEGLTHSLTHPL